MPIKSIRLVTAQFLGALASYRDAIGKIVSKHAKNAAESAVRILQIYPPQRQGQTYIRTGNLGRSWQVIPVGKKNWMIKNTAERRGRLYAQYVHGNEMGDKQAWMHKNRWKKMRPTLESEAAKHILPLTLELVASARQFGIGG